MMKALIRDNHGKLCITHLPRPGISDKEEVLLRIVYTSLCRDDMRQDDQQDIFSHSGIVGHEAVGIIEEAGEYAQVKGFVKGDVVVILPWSFCGHCHHCVSLKPQYCEQSRLHQGIMCQYVVSHVSQLLKVPNGLSYKQAVMIEPVGCVIEAMSSLDLHFQTKVAIIGGGFACLCFIKLLRLRGVKEITVVEPLVERRKLVLHYGADYVIDPESSDFQFDLSTCCDHDGYDVVIETSSNVGMLNIALSYLAKGGTLKVFTYYRNREVLSIPLFAVYYANITISWSCLCSIPSMNIAAEMIKRLALDELIHREFSFDDCLSALEAYRNYHCLKVGITYIPK